MPSITCARFWHVEYLKVFPETNPQARLSSQGKSQISWHSVDESLQGAFWTNARFPAIITKINLGDEQDRESLEVVCGMTIAPTASS
jgi:hypothetical protein